MTNISPTLKCAGSSWVLAWAIAVYFSSSLLALVRPAGDMGFLAHVWAIADEIAPLAKLLIGGGFALAFYAVRRLALSPTLHALLVHAALAVAVLVIVLAFIPQGYSRGFGIGLTGARFSLPELLCFALGCSVAGVVYPILCRRCMARQIRAV